ncbi:hypothetical protein [Niabella digestorum]|jgi:hypothetical protein|uniref:Uncharacterized protein n=1 Tax=Niabella digestorum TaxID=3117701 RepID=A0ABU7RCR1_9BACT
MNYNKQITRYYWSINPIFRMYSTIFLYGPINGSELIGRLYFEDDNAPTLTPHRFENNCLVLFFRWRDMPYIIDMLRNESPLWLWAYINGDKIENATISTDAEPVGEGELLKYEQ